MGMLHVVHRSPMTVNTSSMLKNQKVVLVSKMDGLALATVDSLMSAGAFVHVLSPEPDALLALTHENLSLQTSHQKTDIRSPQALKKEFARQGEFDHLIIAVNAQEVQEPFQFLSEAAAQQAFNNTLWWTISTLQQGISSLSKNGSVLIFSGTCHKRKTAASMLKIAMNAGLESLANSLAKELAPIRVNAILFDKLNDHCGQAAQTVAETLLEAQQIQQQGKIGHAVLHLLENTYLSGSVLDVDGLLNPYK